MSKKLTLALLLALPFAANAQVAIRIGPPAPVVEHYGPAPHPGYVWIGGYHRWDGNRYNWVGGHWAAPPRPGAVWVGDTYEHRGDGWHYRAGYWR